MVWKIGILASVWFIFLGFWVTAIFIYKKPQPVKRAKGWVLFVGLATAITAIIPYYSLGYLVIKIELPPPYQYLANLLGIVILFSGLSLAMWARKTLASFWSGSVAVIENQPVITKGPYAMVRHPIYTGAIAMLWGTFLIGEFTIFLFLASLGTVLLYWKAVFEETILLKYKGEEYRTYMKGVPMLFPFCLNMYKSYVDGQRH